MKNLDRLIDALIYYNALHDYAAAARVIRHSCSSCCREKKTCGDLDCSICMEKWLEERYEGETPNEKV